MKEKKTKTPESLRDEAKEIMTTAKAAAKKKIDEADRLERAGAERLLQKIIAAGKVGELEKLAKSLGDVPKNHDSIES